MWLYFDENGTLIKQLTHGPAARVGTTNFQVFAYFKDVDLRIYNTATIKFMRDDYNDSSHPMLFMDLVRNAPFVLNNTGDMTLTSTIFDPDSRETAQNVYPFEPGHKYTGYLFDFANFGVDEDVSILLDTPGKWHAVITLYAEGTIQNVQGSIEFYVEGPLLESDPYIASLDDIVGNMARQMSSKTIHFIIINSLEGDLTEEELLRIKDNNLNRIVYNNIVYYYAQSIGDTKKYFSIVEQVGGNTNYNEVDVDIRTGHYTVTTAINQYLTNHINDTVVHITQAEREFWNNKVTTADPTGEELILTKN